MPLFFFETQHDGNSYEDQVGIELPDVSEAGVQACQLLSEMTYANDPTAIMSSLVCQVLDDARRVVYRAIMTCERLPI